MRAAHKDIYIYKDIDFYYAFLVKNQADDTAFDLTGYTLAAKVRSEPESPIVLLAFTCTITSPSSGGPCKITAAITSTSPLAAGTYNWDAILTHATAPDIKTHEGKAFVKATSAR